MLDISSSNSVVAERLKIIIAEKGLKQTAIAARAGFTTQELNDMLNGRRLIRAADIAAILNVIKEFGIDANNLFGISSAGKGERRGASLSN